MKYHIVTATGTRVYADTLKEAKDKAKILSREVGNAGIFVHDETGYVILIIFYFNGKIEDVEELT